MKEKLISLIIKIHSLLCWVKQYKSNFMDMELSTRKWPIQLFNLLPLKHTNNFAIWNWIPFDVEQMVSSAKNVKPCMYFLTIFVYGDKFCFQFALHIKMGSIEFAIFKVACDISPTFVLCYRHMTIRWEGQSIRLYRFFFITYVLLPLISNWLTGH